MNYNEIERKRIIAYPYDASNHNGIIVCCKNCGCEFNETDYGYSPVEYEDERENRYCGYCQEIRRC